MLHSGQRLGSLKPPNLFTPPRPMPQTTHFSFNYSLNIPWVTASILLVFHENPQEDTHSLSLVDRCKADAQTSNQQEGLVHSSSKAIQGQARENQDVEMVQGDPEQASETHDVIMVQGVPPPSRKVVTSITDLFKKDDDSDALWCRVVEEPPDE